MRPQPRCSHGFFYVATVNKPAMATKIPGRGSQYAGTFVNFDGNPFGGAKNYKMNVPANMPAKESWSMVVCDPQTRSQLQTSQPSPARITSATSCLPTQTVQSISTSARRHPRARKPTGWPPFPTKAAFRSSNCMDRSRRGSRSPGG